VLLVYNGPKGMELAPIVLVEVGKPVGCSFKLVALTPRTVRAMTQLLRETQKDGDTQTN